MNASILTLSPQGILHLREQPSDDGAAISGAASTRIASAFARGSGHGLFHLGAVEVDTHLPAPFAFFRELAGDLVTTLCAAPDLEELRERVALEPSVDRMNELARAVPPMRGAEYATPECLAALWRSAQAAFAEDMRAYGGTVADYFKEKNPVWNLVGRVFFHLAEHKEDDARPFAFLATYTTRVASDAKPRHRPLGKALEESAEAADKRALLSLLVPVERAGKRSAVVKALTDSGEIYHPLAWTPDEALAFLRDVPALEQCGVVVRVPNFWRARRPPRAEVTVSIGTKKPAGLGQDALLDFSVDLSLDGQTLTRAEAAEILRGVGGLRFVRGQWVEIDREKLSALLSHWKKAEKEARGGLSFLEGMRLIAGAEDIGARAGETARDGDGAAWSRVAPGPWLSEMMNGLRSPEGLAAADPGSLLVATLRPYQEVGVRWLHFLCSLGLGGCLADDMGLGKTIQVLALLLLRKKRQKKGDPRSPSLLVVPASLLGNWTAEAARFAPSLRILCAHPSAMPAMPARAEHGARSLAAIDAAALAGADVVLTTYGTVTRAPWLRDATWDVVVLDEAQAIKNPGAKQTRAVKALKSGTRIALTGTPIENNLGDLYSLFDFLSPGLLGTPTEFSRATKKLEKRTHDAYAPLRELVRPYILRRLKTDRRVIDDLPEKTEVQSFCALTKTQAALYAGVVSELRDKLERAEGIERRGKVLAALLAFKQICNHPSHWLGDGAWDPDASGKFSRLRELCEPLAERQERVLVFTQFRETIDPLARFLAGIFGRSGLVLHGATKVSDRQKLVAEFQADDGPPFFVLSLKAGGTGLNLTGASHVIHFDRWWNPAVENQATDRAYRIGQKKNVLVHKFVCKGTVEEKIDALLESKRGLSDEILKDGGEVPLTEMSNDALMRMVALDIGQALEESA